MEKCRFLPPTSEHGRSHSGVHWTKGSLFRLQPKLIGLTLKPRFSVTSRRFAGPAM
jgi:hypothetical protein